MLNKGIVPRNNAQQSLKVENNDVDKTMIRKHNLRIKADS